jgi:hypothetical protein
MTRRFSLRHLILHFLLCLCKYIAHQELQKDKSEVDAQSNPSPRKWRMPPFYAVLRRLLSE